MGGATGGVGDNVPPLLGPARVQGVQGQRAFPFGRGGCMLPSRTSAEACFSAGKVRRGAGGGSMKIIFASTADSLYQGRNVGLKSGGYQFRRG